jgi:DNA-binding FadR family transcriptional regulator
LIYSAPSSLAGLGLTLSDLMTDEPSPAPDTDQPKAVDPMTEALLARTCEMQEEQKRMQEHQLSLHRSLAECTQNLSLLKEQLDLTADLLHKRMDGTDTLLAANTSAKEALSTALQSLRSEILVDRHETTARLQLLNASLDTIRESLSRGFTTRIKDLFGKPARSKN